MYIKERNGKYRYFQSYKDPLTEKKKTVSVTLDSKSRAAQKKARIMLTERINDRLNNHQSTATACFDDYLNQWLDFKKKHLKPSSFRTLQNIVGSKNFKKIIPEQAILKNITPKYLNKKFDDLLYVEKLSNNYVHSIKNSLSNFYDWLIENEIVNDNPVRKVKIIWKSNDISKTQNKFLEKGELDAILKKLWKQIPTTAAICEWQYLTGMRFGEAAALDFQDVELKEDIYVCHVHKTTGTTVNGVEILNTPKTQSGVRDVELPQRAVEIYFHQKEMYETGLIFRNQRNHIMQASIVNANIRNVNKEVGINKQITTHVFRHTHISKLAELGVPLYVIQKRVGHSDSEITKRIYLHVTKKAQRKLIDKLDEL